MMRSTCITLAALCAALPAVGAEINFKLEPGVALPLTSPQSDVYGVGGGQSVKLHFGITDFLEVGPAASFMLLPARQAGAESGVVWGFGAGLRLKRPHDATTLYGISPWVDADALYIRTGPLNRAGFDAAVGVAIPVGEARAFWVGPFVRYTHVLQPVREGFDNRDAKLLTLGVSFEFGAGSEKKQDAAVVPEERPAVAAAPSCPDMDADRIPDDVDHCPEVAGPMDFWGCPPYEKVIVKKDKLELKEKLYFAWDAATLEPASYPVLDEVVRALKENSGFRVQVEGHTDSSGADDHNQSLSERRAEAVLDYLAAHGISKDRLTSKGFSSSVPRDTNDTAVGRENNRRVEFVVSFILLNQKDSQ